MASVTASASSPSAPATTIITSGWSAASAAKAPHQRRDGLAALQRADGQHERSAATAVVTAASAGSVVGAAIVGPTEVDHGDGVGGQQLTDPDGGGFAGRMDVGPVGHRSAQHVSRSAHHRVGLVRMVEEPAVVHRHQAGPSAGCDHVVGAVHEVERSEESFDRGHRPSRPQPMGERSGEREPSGRGLRTAPAG